MVDLPLIDIKCHRTARSHNCHLVLLAQADANSRTITRSQCFRTASANVLVHPTRTVLTNGESVEAVIGIITKGDSTTITLSNCQLYLDREITEYVISKTPTEIIDVLLCADAIGSSDKLARASSTALPFPFLAERIKECECALPREIPRVCLICGSLVHLCSSAISEVEKKRSCRSYDGNKDESDKNGYEQPALSSSLTDRRDRALC